MNYEDVLKDLEDRLAELLASADDNPIYEDHTSRAIFNYLQGIRIVKEILRKGD